MENNTKTKLAQNDADVRTDKFEIFEEGFHVMEGQATAHSIGYGYGKTFEEACEEFINRTGIGEKRVDSFGNIYYCYWGCRWFPTLKEAQKSFG